MAGAATASAEHVRNTSRVASTKTRAGLNVCCVRVHNVASADINSLDVLLPRGERVQNSRGGYVCCAHHDVRAFNTCRGMMRITQNAQLPSIREIMFLAKVCLYDLQAKIAVTTTALVKNLKWPMLSSRCLCPQYCERDCPIFNFGCIFSRKFLCFYHVV